MKLSNHFITHQMDGVTLLVPMEGTAFHGVVKGNRSVATILECLQQDTTEEEIVRVMCRKYDGDPRQIAADVKDVLTQLSGIGAIEA